ncbi:MAG: histidine kinase, partial [Ferruginibacter sp.]
GKEIKRFYQVPGREGLIKDKLGGIKSEGNNLLLYSSRGAQWFDVARNHFTKLTVSANQAAVFQNSIFDASITSNKICFVTTYTGAYAYDSTGKLIFRYDQHKPNLDGTVSGSRYGYVVMDLNKYQVLHFDKEYNMSLYDSRKNSYLSIDAYKNTLPGLYSLRGMMAIKGRPGKNLILFLNFYTMETYLYDVTKDLVQKQLPPTEWIRKNISWASNLLTVNDSTAIIYGGVPGLYTIQIDRKTLQLSYDSIPLFNKQICTAAILDRDDRLWIGTKKGLFRQNIKKTSLHSIKHPLLNQADIIYPIPFSSFLRKNHLLYAGTYSRLPIMILDGNNYKLKKEISFSSLSPLCNQLWHILEYNKDTLWFATQDGLIWYDEHSGNFNRVSIPGMDTLIKHKTITMLYKDSKGLIWLQPGWGGGLIMYNPISKTAKRFLITDKKNPLPLRVVNFVTEDKDGNIWFAENGLTRWNRQKEHFDTLITSYYGINKDNIKIISLGNDKKGNLIFCNENNGVLSFNSYTNTYKQISTLQGLPENAAYNAIALNNDYLWVVSHNYITAIHQNNFNTISYSYSDSLPISSLNTIYHDNISKRMLFGYDNEIIWINDSISERNNKPISFYIDELQIADDTILVFPGENIQLKYSQNDITIHYTALNFDEAESNRYAYRVNQKEWVSSGSENAIHFSNLSPGNYQIEIKYYSASNPGVEVIRKIKLLVEPPFWKTWWFYTIIGLAILTIAWLLYKKRIYQIRQHARIDRQLAESEIKALRAQMNPHFIFNSLNSIMEMVLNDEKTNASRYLSNYAQLIRLNLEHSERTFISLRENVEYLQLYIELEHIRTNSFVHSITVDENLNWDEILLPPMLIQPFIENAIWYGPSKGKRPMNLDIRFLINKDQLLCVIEDNGMGFEASQKNKNENMPSHTPMGIGNVRQRIRILNEKYRLNCTFAIEDKQRMNPSGESGTKVTIGLPLNFNDI